MHTQKQDDFEPQTDVSRVLRTLATKRQGAGLPYRSDFGVRNSRVEVLKDGRRIVKGLASTPALDRHGDVLDPMGVQLSHFVGRNASFLAGHAATLANGLPSRIGTVLSVTPRKDGVGFMAREAKRNPIAKVWWDMIEDGDLDALSVGWIPLEEQREQTTDGRTFNRFTRWELCEISVVVVPANPEALFDRLKAVGVERSNAAPLLHLNGMNPNAADANAIARGFDAAWHDVEQCFNAMRDEFLREADEAVRPRVASAVRRLQTETREPYRLCSDTGNRVANSAELRAYIASHLGTVCSALEEIREAAFGRACDGVLVPTSGARVDAHSVGAKRRKKVAAALNDIAEKQERTWGVTLANAR